MTDIVGGRIERDRPRIPVTVIGGYLGAGKTTLLNHLLSAADGERIAALVNDFGAIGIDAELVASRDGDVIQLTNGCICCSLSEGFAQAMQRIDEFAPRPERLVIETSGVADPGAVAQYAHLPGFRLDAVIVLADAETIRTRSRDRYVGRQVLEQLRHADVIVLNKIDLVEAATVSSLLAWMADTARAIPVLTTVQSNVPHRVLFEPSTVVGRPNEVDDEQHLHATHPPDGDGEAHRSWAMVGELAVDRAALLAMIDGLPASIVRGKGIVTFDGDSRRWVLQKVGARTTCTPTPALGSHPPEPGCRLVFIGLPSTGQDAAITTLAAGLGLRLVPEEAHT